MRDGGVMTPYRNLVKFGLGGHKGSGNQKFSWIHIEDCPFSKKESGAERGVQLFIAASSYKS
ncbi:hypothetical protein [Peribacillus frigoritolerans]|uniref:hypothetical protein n=1 Tax=Peribacillus frigoritolerans TaxID=450367 RepID=UPI00277D5688|nr:hypothetical protein [Bacillus sp. B2I3]MED3788698.1 hypothetical protein [Peribacillus frigoritolerans]WVN11770.1 hypothetical protein V2I71_03830 [Peribacillus frigoritolerans]